MIKLLKRLRGREWGMIALCAALVLGQIYFDLRLPDFMSDLTVLVKTPGSTMTDILTTGGKMLACTLASAVRHYMRVSLRKSGSRIQLHSAGKAL